VSDTVTLTIDGTEVTVPKGTKVIEAAKKLGKRIPHFCYHPGLPVDGNCRMCIADVRTWNARAEKHFPARRPAVTCWTDAEENMQVFTETEMVLKARASVMEFLLVNHPIDCPICDKAGECMLQDYYMRHDRKRSELREEKVHKPRLKPFGDRILYNGERCILCSRCTRFTTHVTKTFDLGIVNRGDRAIVELTKTSKFDHAYTDNVADVCPVGALTKIDFRFKKRVWYLKHTESVCGGCSRNCNTVVDHDGKDIIRVMPRERADINQHWLCNEGRDLYKTLENVDRPTAPLVRVDGVDSDPGWKAAIALVGEALAEQKKAGRMAGIASTWMSNEEALLFSDLLGKKLKCGRLDVKTDVNEGYPADDLLHTDDHNPNRRGVAESGVVPGKKEGRDLAGILEDCAAGEVDVLVVWGPGLVNHFDGDAAAMQEALSGVGMIVQATWKHDELSALAHVVLPARSWAEKSGTWTNVDGHQSQFRKALRIDRRVRDDFELLVQLTVASGIKKPVADTLKAARKKLKAVAEEAQEVVDGEFSFPKNQTMYRHHGGVLEV
jgi:NADH-quinone oxidoreductase subunit G